MIEVGQGDCAFIHLPNNKGNILIDTGNQSYYNIINYLKSEGVSRLDYLVITHSDNDHSYNAVNLINNFNIDNVILNSGNNSSNEISIINTDINYYLFSENILELNNYKFYFLNRKNTLNENFDSLIMYTKINNMNILFMGDASINEENIVINEYNIENIDILKVGHHGSKYSTGLSFLKKIKPVNSIISVGINNIYNHPSIDVINNLLEVNSNIYKTSECGAIKVNLNTKKIKCATLQLHK